MVLSKKMLMALVALVLVSAGFFACGWLPLLAAQYTTFVGAVSGILGLFLVGKVAAQHVEKKGETEQAVAVTKAQVDSGQTVTAPQVLPAASPAPSVPAPE